jgi:UPF0755 protein
MKYTAQTPRTRRWPRRLTFVLVIGIVLTLIVTIAVRQIYDRNLEPVSDNMTTQLVTVDEGSSVDTIAKDLEQKQLIRSAWAFKLYVSTQQVRGDLQAGTYALAPSQSVAQIVAQLTHGKVATNMVTILPGQRIDQVRKSLVNDGFSEADVDAALEPSQYASNPALVDKPAAASLEGYLYPDTFEKTGNTTAKDIVKQSLAAMEKQLSPERRAQFAKQGISTYQAIILASMVEKEASKQADRKQVAQTFLLRIKKDMSLGSDPTAFYGAAINGQPASVTYDTPYNTLLHKGLPPTPISNVSAGSLQAVASPSATDWVYFVAGDDGTVHFSRTLEEHEALIDQYCHKLCGN